MSKMNDLFKVFRNEDLDDNGFDDFDEVVEEKKSRVLNPKKTPKKVSKTEEKPEWERTATRGAIVDATEYAGSKKVSDDLLKALKGETFSTDLRKLIQVLMDDPGTRKFFEACLALPDVKAPDPEPDSYDINPVYKNAKGEIVADVVVEAMFKSGTKLNDLGMTAEFFRVDKETQKQIGRASKEEAQKYLEDRYKASKS